VEKRDGYTKHVTGDTATTNPITGLFRHDDGTTDVLVRVEGGDIDTSDNGGAWTAIEGTETISATATDLVIATQYVLNSIFTDGVNIPLKWTGTGNVAKIAQIIDAGTDTITRAYTLVRHEERIVLGNVKATISTVPTEFPSRIWASTIGTLDDWEAEAHASTAEIEEGDGDTITNLQSILGYLVVFKQGSLHRIDNYGIAASQRRRKVAAVGTPGKHTAVAVGPFIYFLDVNGRLWVYDVRGDNEDSVVEISAPKLGKVTYDLLDTDRFKYSHLHYEPVRSEIYCFVTETGSSNTNLAWVYNTVSGDSGD
jgi:hypothetical protein